MSIIKHQILCIMTLTLGLSLPSLSASEKKDALYWVIDLSGGASAAKYQVSVLSIAPANGWADEYKTTKLVLRKIEAGTFSMGSPKTEMGRNNNEDSHMVTLTKSFYIGIFEVTQQQWELVMGSNPSLYKGNIRPVDQVSYSMIRGGSMGLDWPASDSVDPSSFIGRLRDKTGISSLDLPTEAQWEYACRAGVTNVFNTGKDLTNMENCSNLNTAGRYKLNKSDGKGGSSEHTSVGCYTPNRWGLYDMHGNVWEWCLDCYQLNLGSAATVDPVGAALSPNHILRGGSWNSTASTCRSAMRNSNSQTYCSSGYTGLRLACTDSGTQDSSKGLVVVFDPGKGEVRTESKILRENAFYGELPLPLRYGFQFKGWYLNISKSEAKITATSRVTLTTNHTLTAKWEISQPRKVMHNEWAFMIRVFDDSAIICEGNAHLKKQVSLSIPARLDSYTVAAVSGYAFGFDSSGDAFGVDSSDDDILTSITLPHSIISIDTHALHGCRKLTTINVDEANRHFSSKEGVLYNKDKTTLLFYPKGKKESHFAVPSSVSRIGNNVFSYKEDVFSNFDCSKNSTLKTITLPTGLKYISDRAFISYLKLEAIRIPGCVISIGNEAFYNCEALSSVTIDNGVGLIGNSAFRSCGSLSSVTIGEGVSQIGDSAFRGCTNLASITIPSSVTNIGKRAFTCNDESYNESYYDGREFQVCKFAAITVSPESIYYASENGVLYDKSRKVLILYPVGKKDTQYVIPSGVTRIGKSAFDGCTSLTSIDIASSVTTIEDGAFSGCINLASINIPSSVTNIGAGAFSGCISLTSTIIPSSVKNIGDFAFSFTSLTSINIPESVTTIGTFFVQGCQKLEAIHVDKNNLAYSSNSGVLYNKTQTQLIAYPTGKVEENFDVPNTVSSLSGSAFNGCQNLRSVSIPSGLLNIGEKAFLSCRNLTSVALPNTVTNIGELAFGLCHSLISIRIPNSVLSIENWAFSCCDKLESIDIPSSVTYIGKGVFAIDKLASIKVDASNPVYSSRDGVLFDKAKSTLILYPSAKSRTSYIIPYGVETIGELAFAGSSKSNFERIAIPHSVKNIGYNSFLGLSCSCLFIPNSVTNMPEGNVKDVTHAFVISSSKAAITEGIEKKSSYYDSGNECQLRRYTLNKINLNLSKKDFLKLYPNAKQTFIDPKHGKSAFTLSPEESSVEDLLIVNFLDEFVCRISVGITGQRMNIVASLMDDIVQKFGKSHYTKKTDATASSPKKVILGWPEGDSGLEVTLWGDNMIGIVIEDLTLSKVWYAYNK